MDGLASWACDTHETRQLRERMVAGLVQAGDITDERWRQVFATVPRHALVPRYYRLDNYLAINATTVMDHSVWLRSVYSDDTLITQKTARTVTSSGTMPGLVALMLRALDVRDHQRVFQAGTGTGYTAGLLCDRVGSKHVTTVDIDSELVWVAASRLASMGYHPTAVSGNGADGYLPNAPYDRFLTTCALRRIPSTWLAQAAPGARIVAPIAKGLATVDVRDANHAVGYFLVEGGYFRPLRDSVGDSTVSVADRAETTTQNHSRRTVLGPRDTFYQQHVRFLLAVVLPEVSVGQHGSSLDDLIITDHAGSSARLDSTDDGSFLVTETGPRALEQRRVYWSDAEPGD
ncbi:MAG: hypothetical protein ACRDR6_10915 [Pseudonocardiaceae bacterium]